MSIQRFVAFLALLVAFSAHAKESAIYKEADEFKGTTLYFSTTSMAKLEGGSFLSERYLLINFVAHQPTKSTDVTYAIKVDSRTPNWLFIKDGESLILKADDKIINLRGPGSLSNREVLTGMAGGVRETAIYEISMDDLKTLAAAKAVQFRVYGDKGQITGVFSPGNMKDLAFFVSEIDGVLAKSDQPATAP